MLQYKNAVSQASTQSLKTGTDQLTSTERIYIAVVK